MYQLYYYLYDIKNAVVTFTVHAVYVLWCTQKFSICCVIIMAKHIVIIQVRIVESFRTESIDMGSLL